VAFDGARRLSALLGKASFSFVAVDLSIIVEFGMRLTDFKVLAFDCYGTLIDWESGLSDACRGQVARSGKLLTPDQILETHARYEAYQEAKRASPVDLH